jgi:hypothetical protein
VAGALRSNGFAGRLILEPGRALVTDAVALAFSVVAVKELDDGTRCVVADAGTNLLPGALWSWPTHRGHRRRRAADVVRARQRPAVPERRRPAPGGRAARGGAGRRAARARRRRLSAGAIDPLRRPAPAVVAYDDGRWRVSQRRETLDDLLAGDHDVALAPAGSEEVRP